VAENRAYADLVFISFDAFVTAYLGRMSPEQARTSLSSVLLPEIGAVYRRATLSRGDQKLIAPRGFGTKMWARRKTPAYSYRFVTLPSGISPHTLGAYSLCRVSFVLPNVDGVVYEVNFLAANFAREREEYLRLSDPMSRMRLRFVD
jgi:hypothetical protein